MDATVPYSAGITAEQFLFRESRIVAQLYLQELSLEEIVAAVKKDNLFQYPTERKTVKMTRACHRRIEALGCRSLVEELASAPLAIAKQINLYAMMRQNRLVWEFMIHVIGEKYTAQDLHFERKDLNIFFTRLQEQDDAVAAWSDASVQKIKQVLTKMLVEADFLDEYKSTTLNNIYLYQELEDGIRANKDFIVLPAFQRTE